MGKVDLYWIKLKTTNNDSYGPIYVYINVETISSISRFKDITNIYLTNGGALYSRRNSYSNY